MAAGALLVPSLEGGCLVDLRSPLNCMTLMTRLTGLFRQGRRPVGLVTIEAGCDRGRSLLRAASMLQMHLGVTLAAFSRREGLISVGMMAVEAVLVRMDFDCSVLGLGLSMTGETIVRLIPSKDHLALVKSPCFRLLRRGKPMALYAFGGRARLCVMSRESVAGGAQI